MVEQRLLGRTGLTIPAVVFGAGAVGGAVFTGDPEARSAVVGRALALGIDWIDTAAMYGDGASEENLGRILPGFATDPRISTKVRLSAADLDDIPAAVERSFRASLDRLRRRSITLFQLHNRIEASRDATTGALGVDDVLGAGGVADALEQIRARGGTQLIGITGLGDADALHAVLTSRRFDTVQAYHNLLNPSAGRAVPAGFAAYDYRRLITAAEREGMGVLVIRVMAAGAIAGAAPRAGRQPLSPGSAVEEDLRRAAAAAAALAGEPGTMPQRSIRFALDTPGVSGVLVGFSDVAQVEEAAAAADLAPLSASALATLEQLWASDFRSY
ncbi:MAG: aldo/keto reductase [Chloroflexi bacterium]|nr:aldo/keto reductase [Chloroflexota bacterium]